MSALGRLCRVVRTVVKYRRFFYAQRVKGFEIPNEPHFDPLSTPVFMSLLNTSRSYLEYGAGGSTVVAAKLGKTFLSVDTDPYFLRAVAAKIGALGANQRLVHANIGLTRDWGVPIPDSDPSSTMLAKWRAFAGLPWTLIDAAALPDLVLIDGRFRVAAALTSIHHLRHRPDATILVDDYTDREPFHVIERFAELRATHGRMAEFHTDGRNEAELPAAIDHYLTDWR